MVKGSESVLNALSAKARTDVNVFAEFVFRFKQADCHRTIQRHMREKDRAGVIAHKDLGKTSQALIRLLHLLGNNPMLRIKVLCSGDELAADRIMFIRDVITRNRYLHRVFPGLKKHTSFDDWGRKSLTVERDGYLKDSSVEACGVLTSGTGGRSDVLLFDDVVDFQNAIKHPSQRALVKKAFKNVWIPTLEPDGQAGYLATPHHEDDLTEELRENSEWHFIDMSVKGDPPVSPWKARWSTAALIKRFKEIGSLEFDRSMRCILHPDGERIVREEWIHRFGLQVARGGFRICSWDLAAGGKKGDYMARAVIDVFLEEKVVRVLSIDRRRGLTYGQMIDWILEDFNTWTPDEVTLESTGFQVVIGRDERVLPLPVHLYTPKVGKEQRVQQTAVLYERGFVMFKDGACESGIDELMGFPKGAKDDMCLSGETLIETDAGPVAIKEIRVGDKVLTRAGFKRALASSMTSDCAHVFEAEFSSGAKLRGTGNHPIFVHERGFVRLDSLAKGDMIESCRSRLRLSPGMGEYGEGTPDLLTGTTEFIFKDTKVISGTPFTFTGKNGKNSEGRFQRGGISTIEMEIPLITELTILPAYLEKSIKNLKRLRVPIARRQLLKTSIASDISLSRGTRPKTANCGIRNMEKMPGKTERDLRSAASCAGYLFGLSGQPLQSSVPVVVRCVTELREKEPVYNLRVESSKEYFANGILVHNCDALTQGLLRAIERLGKAFNPGDCTAKGGRVFGSRSADAKFDPNAGSGGNRVRRRTKFGSIKW